MDSRDKFDVSLAVVGIDVCIVGIVILINRFTPDFETPEVPANVSAVPEVSVPESVTEITEPKLAATSTKPIAMATTTPPTQQPGSFFSTAFITATQNQYVVTVIEGINAERAKESLPALRVNALLQSAAYMKLGDMETKHYFSHENPQGKDFTTFFQIAGYYTKIGAGENLARRFPNASDVVPAFMTSPAHRANVLSTDYPYKEIGVAYSPVDHLLVVHFGAR